MVDEKNERLKSGLKKKIEEYMNRVGHLQGVAKAAETSGPKKAVAAGEGGSGGKYSTVWITFNIYTCM